MEKTDYLNCQPLKLTDDTTVIKFMELFNREPNEMDLRLINGWYHLHKHGFVNRYSFGASFGGFLCAFYRIPLRSLYEDDMPGVRTYVPDNELYDYQWRWHLLLSAWRKHRYVDWSMNKMGNISVYSAHLCDIMYNTSGQSNDDKIATMIAWWMVHTRIERLPDHHDAMQFVNFIHKKRSDEICNKISRST